MFKTGLDVDPFRYVTLPSLTMGIYRGHFLPSETIVANEQNKKMSLLCKEWLIHLNDKHLLTEYPLVIDTSKYMTPNTPGNDIDDDVDDNIAFDSEDDCSSTEVPSDTLSVISQTTLQSSEASSSTDIPPSIASSSSNDIPPPPTPPKKY